MRASLAAEKAGIPSVTKVCSGFAAQSKAVARMAGMPGARLAVYPGHIDTDAMEQRAKYVEEVILPQVIEGLTKETKEEPFSQVKEPEPKDIVFSGDFREVNAFFQEKQWADGLPILPPTIDAVQEFLRYTDRSPDEVIGVLPPANRQATVWSVAVNGVMCGCRPEYMPVLLALVEVMGDPYFGINYSGATPGWEALIILDGPIIKELGFAYKAGLMRPGAVPNTTVGRFWRLYVRNMAGFLPAGADKTTWGMNFNVALAENMDALKEIGWEPLSVERGFKADDNVVTVQSIRGRGLDIAVKGSTGARNLDCISYALLGFHTRLYKVCFQQCPLVGITPVNARVIARDFSKKDVKRYLWEHTRQPAHVFEELGDEGTPWAERPGIGKGLCDAVQKGMLSKLYCESDDPNRMLPVWRDPEELTIVVSGDPERNRALITGSNFSHGRTTSKKIKLPANWQSPVK